MSWNYRIVKTEHSDGTTEFGIHECFYADPNSDDGVSVTVNPMPVSTFQDPEFDDKLTDEHAVEELRLVLNRMQMALTKPIIDSKDL